MERDDHERTKTDVGASSPRLLPVVAAGTVLGGRYRVEEEIGRGGMGIVYRGRDLTLERDVAVKILGVSDLDRSGREWLLHEARSAATLNHPGVVGVYDTGEHGELSFLVMELVRGSSLPRERFADLGRLISIARQICEALRHAHSHGLIHRDLKPDNVLLIDDGNGSTVKLADLGLAFRRGGAQMVREGVAAGTASYMAPEQAVGAVIDPRADLYSLGVMLFELTTGRLPFTGDDPLAVVSQHLHAPPVPPRSLRCDLPRELDKVILRLLAKNPDDRYESAGAVLEALAGVPEHADDDTGDEATRLLQALVRGRIVGRDGELDRLRELWRMATDGHSGLALISGEPGSGKTRLARELIDYARIDGGVVLSGGCYEYEATTPYLPFVEAIRHWSANQSDDALREMVGDAGPELARLAPAVESRLGPFEDRPELPPHEERLRLFDHIARFLQRLAASRGLLVFIDDLQWADHGSLSLLHYLLRMLREDPVLFVGAYREVELDRAHPLAKSLEEWNRERLATRIRVGRLKLADTTALVATLLAQETVTDEFAEIIHKETEGNPFFIEELLKALIDDGNMYRQGSSWNRREIGKLALPQSVKVAIGGRLERVGDTCGEVLRTAAVLGKRFDFDALAAASSASEDDLLDALDEAVTAQLIVSEPPWGFVFSHDKIRELLYDELNPIRRRRLHSRILDGLARRRDQGAPVAVADLAHHALHGADYERGLRFSLEAAREAQSVYAHREAIALFVRARECAEALDRNDEIPRIEESTAEVYRMAGELTNAIDHYKRALDLARSPEKRAALRCRIGEYLVQMGEVDGLDHVRQALEDLDPERQPKQVALARMVEGRYYHLVGRPAQATEFLEQARVLAESADDPLLLGMIYSYLAGAYQHLADFETSNAWARRVIALGERTNQPFNAALGWEFLAENTAFLGPWNLGLEYTARERELAERIHSVERAAWSDWSRGYVLLGNGRLGESRAAFDEAFRVCELIGDRRLATLVEIGTGMVLVELGRGDEALEVAGRVNAAADEMGLQWSRLEARRLLCYVRLRTGDARGAVDAAREWETVYADSEELSCPLWTQATFAESFLAAGDADTAERLLTDNLARLSDVDSPHLEGQALRVRARLRESRGEIDDAVDDLDASIERLESSDSRLELARSLLQRAELLDRRGRGEAGRRDAERSRELFSRCGVLTEPA